MCGRYQLDRLDPGVLDALPASFNLPKIGPRYNVAPTQKVPAIVRSEVREMRWGFERGPRLLINARGETVHRLPAFKNAFTQRRCLLPATGYYEWHGTASDGKKQPYLIRRQDRRPLWFAGIWETDEGESRAVIITNDATPQLAALHDRMPLWLAESDWDEWLGETSVSHRRLVEWQERALDDAMETMPVSTRLNSARNEGVELLESGEQSSAPAPFTLSDVPDGQGELF